MDQQLVIALNAVVVAVTEQTPRIMTVRHTESSFTPLSKRHSPDEDKFEIADALPFGPFDPSVDRTLELGLSRWVRDQTGLDLRPQAQDDPIDVPVHEDRAIGEMMKLPWAALSSIPLAYQGASWSTAAKLAVSFRVT